MANLTAPMIWIMQSGIYDVLQIYDLDGSGDIDYWEVWINGSVAGTVVNDDTIVYITMEELGCTGTGGWNIGVMGRVNDSDEYVTGSSNFVAYYGDHSFDNNGADPDYGDTVGVLAGGIYFYKNGELVHSIASGTYIDNYTEISVTRINSTTLVLTDDDGENVADIVSYDYGKTVYSYNAQLVPYTTPTSTTMYHIYVYALVPDTITTTYVAGHPTNIAINNISTRQYWEYNSDYELINELYLVSGMCVGQPYSHTRDDGQAAGDTGEIFNDYEHNIASGKYSHAEGYNTLAKSYSSHAEGYATFAQGNYSHAEGYHTCAKGGYSHAEGYNTCAKGGHSHAEGCNTCATGNYSHAEGWGTYAKGQYSHASGCYTSAQDYQTAIGKYNAYVAGPSSVSDTTASSALFVVGIGTDLDARSNGFRINPAGRAYSTASFVGSGADYAEYFEWADGNPSNEDRRGRFVTLDSNKIRYATSEDDYVLGIVSAEPSILGDAHSEAWKDMYLRDVFGSKIQEVVEVEETTDENGVVTPAHTERRWVLNPDYDPNAKYLSREERPEWDAVGIVGKLVAVDDGTCVVNSYCYPGADGIATASSERTNYRVIERIDDTHVRVFIK